MVRQYVGARYVPKFADPVAWASGTSYEAMTIVTYNNSSYTSKIPVPATVGDPADNPDYWALTGNYNAQVEQYRQATETVSNNLTTEIANRKNADTALQGQITTLQSQINQIVADSVYAMKECKFLKEGDYVKTSGYYNVNDGGGALYKIVSTKPNKYYETINNGLYALLLVNDFLNVKCFGAIGNDSSDDTEFIKKAIDYAYQNGLSVLVPKGTYKITKTLVFDHDLQKLPTPQIIGVGADFTTKDGQSASLFKGYNIEDKRGIMEFTGRGVNQATGITMSHIGFTQDTESCGGLSFDLVVGDANVPTFEKCYFEGYNNLCIRCGTAIDATGYIFSNAKFEQCFFITKRYLPWGQDEIPLKINAKAIYGFCIAPEHIWYKNRTNIWDNVTFSECNFLGCTCVYGNVLFSNCMWEIPGTYRPQIDVSKFPNGILVSSTVLSGDMGVAVLGGNIALDNCYFEDVRKAIALINTSFGGRNLSVRNTIANATLNRSYTVDGISYLPEYFVKTEGTYFTVGKIIIENCSYAVGNVGGYQEGFLISKPSMTDLKLTSNSNVTPDMIKVTSCKSLTYNDSILRSFPMSVRKDSDADYGKTATYDITNLKAIKNNNNLAFVESVDLIFNSTNVKNSTLKIGECDDIGDGKNYNSCTNLTATNYTIDSSELTTTTLADKTIHNWKVNKVFTKDFITAFILDGDDGDYKININMYL